MAVPAVVSSHTPDPASGAGGKTIAGHAACDQALDPRLSHSPVASRQTKVSPHRDARRIDRAAFVATSFRRELSHRKSHGSGAPPPSFSPRRLRGRNRWSRRGGHCVKPPGILGRVKAATGIGILGRSYLPIG